MVKRGKKDELIKLHLEATGDPMPGFRTVGSLTELKSDSVDELFYHYGLQRLSGAKRAKFMEELYRVLKVGAKATVVTPYYSSMRAIMDYCYEWPPICEMSYLYFNKGWREANKVPDLKCDFDFTYGYTPENDMAAKATDVQAHWVKHYLNSALDLQVTLTKRGK